MKQWLRLGTSWSATIILGLALLVYFQFFRAPPMLADSCRGLAA